ncbi:uncharacterized protein LOC129915685 [Episyrphus balteatus]|uniref:uncharacterized protein LOC129915685 n=1 Tax=Episyrphus balteatus TaxID=286459 RepID=UPI0024869A70|nr:uncharacterized protein LOC129915685 [Episyrphus balteatus]
MIRQKSKKTVEDLYMAVPPPTLFAGTTRFDDDSKPNSKPNNKINGKTDLCFPNTVLHRKKTKGKKNVEKKDENEEILLGRCKMTNEFGTETKFFEEKEKDEGTDEFLSLIKETVEGAVEKSLQDMVARSLRDMRIKLDEIQERVDAYGKSLEKIQSELGNKIIHYGEENSRHFRYLCMKSEYDKMFYQNQNAMNALSFDARQNVSNSLPSHLTTHIKDQTTHRPKQIPQPIQPEAIFLSKPRQNSNQTIVIDFDCAQQSKLSGTSKSSDMGVREVKDLLEQLQKFYDEHNHKKDDKKDSSISGKLNIPDQDDSADGDEDDETSDDMTSESIEENIRAGGDS